MKVLELVPARELIGAGIIPADPAPKIELIAFELFAIPKFEEGAFCWPITSSCRKRSGRGNFSLIS